MIPIYIVNFNTTDLTNNAIQSIIDNLKSYDYQIFIFDNSDKQKFKLTVKTDKVTIIDNTEKQLIDFDIVVKENSNSKKISPNNYGSLKHCFTINWIITHETRNFLLFDSDIILKRDIDFIDDNYITIASVCKQMPKWKDKFYPFIQYFNVKQIKENNIQYFDKNRIMFGYGDICDNYDTGTSFYDDVIEKKLKYKNIDYKDYIYHLDGGSWKKTIKLKTDFMTYKCKTVVTMTSWKKRIQYVSRAILNFIVSLSIKPNIFYLWLAEEEFPNKDNDLPNDLLETIKKFNITLKWCKDTKVHKRWNVYPEHYNDIVYSIDDDCVYSNDLIKNGIEYSTLFPFCPCMIWKQFYAIPTYNNTSIHNFGFKNSNALCDPRVWLCGQVIFPPNTFPLESLNAKNIEFRNKYVISNDEVWLYSFLVKNFTPITCILNITLFKEYSNSQNDALFKMHKEEIDINGIKCTKSEILLYKCLKYNNSLNNYKKLFINYNTKNMENYEY